VCDNFIFFRNFTILMENNIDVSKSRIFIDLMDYAKYPGELVLQRCQYAATELAFLWNNRKGILDFYTSTDLYIYDLTLYQLLLEHNGAIAKMIAEIDRLGLKSILEYGGGIGEFSLMCGLHGLQVTYFELEGKTKEYAKWRFAKHGCGDISLGDDGVLDRIWDCVNIMDVLEHMEDPDPIIAKLAKNARYIFCNPEQVKYNSLYPQHISKFDISPFFENVEGYLWKNKTLK
jgi:hypothetical protein